MKKQKEFKGYQFKRTMPLIPTTASYTEGPVPPTFTIKGKPMKKPKGSRK